MRPVSALRACTASLAGFVCFSGIVQAQEKLVLEEVVTTAQRRTEFVQDVPISVTTLEGEKFDNLFDGGEDIRALATRVPSLYAESSNGRLAPRFYIRGLGNTDFDLAASQPVSVIFDDVIQENVILKSFPLFDVARVEVLRGPQGTLFGRNTPAGIVKLETRKPTAEQEGYLATSYAPGSAATAVIEAAAGGAISDSLNTRISVLLQDRSDWIDNNVPAGSDFNGLAGEDVMGGFLDYAYRAQFHYTPNDKWNALLNLHSRKYEGTASIFRANAVSPGIEGFNANYDRDAVTYDEGNNNPQEADAFGGSLKVEIELDDRTTLTSITAHEVVQNQSLGDIDGGYGADFLPSVGPCPPSSASCIPFPSVTQDGLNSLDQFTQEIRVARQVDDKTFWQAGIFLFDGEFAVETNPFFAPPSLVGHENESYAVFGHISRDISDKMTVTGGVRFTNDDKKAIVHYAPAPSAPVSISDHKLSWDFSALYRKNENLNLFARLASGFRAPTIQSRDVAFFGAPSIAGSETINSIESGFKATLANDRIRLNGSVYYYRINDQQLSAIGGGGNFVRLVNAEKGTALGIDIDGEFLINERLTVTAGFSGVDTELDDPNLVVPPCGSGLCTVTNPLDANGNAMVDGNAFANAPSYILTVTTDYAQPYGPNGELFFFTDWAFQGKTEFLLYQTQEFLSSDSFEAGMKIGYRNLADNWELALFGRNITDEENVKGAIDFNNLTVFDNEPRVVGISFRKNWKQ